MNRAQRRAFRDLPRAEYQRIGDQMETSGCSRCHVRFGGGVPYFIGKLPSGKWAGRCMKPECSSAFLQTAPVFIGTTIVASDPWTEDDREWFRANPKRRWRLRWPMPGEVETLATDEHLADQAQAFPKVADQARGALRRRHEGATIAIAVYQFEPGKRLRTPFEFISSDPPDSYTDAATPALAPFLVEIAQNHRVALLSGSAAKAALDAQMRRRFEAMAKIVQGDAS